MKLIRIVALMMALLLLCGCSSGLEEEHDKDGDRKDSPSSTEPETTAAPTQEALVSVDCLTSIVSRSDGEERTATIRYETDGVHLIPYQLAGEYMSVYSPEGLELYELRYNEEGVADRRSEYVYNSDGQKTEYLYYYLDEGYLARRSVYEYDAEGHLLSLRGYYGKDGLADGYWEYSYDEQGNRILSSYTDSDGVNTWRYTYTYDENRRIATETTFFPYGSNGNHSQLGYYSYTYDASGLLTKKLWTETTGSYFVHNDYYYSNNEAGRLTEIKEIDKHGEVDSLISYTYDAQNRLTGMHEEDGDYVYSVSFLYTQLELPQSLAEAAEVWSNSGLIAYYFSQSE